jgi:hypothetical protein
MVDELPAVVAVNAQKGEGKFAPDLLYPLLDPAMAAVQEGVFPGPAGARVGTGEGLAELDSPGYSRGSPYTRKGVSPGPSCPPAGIAGQSLHRLFSCLSCLTPCCSPLLPGRTSLLWARFLFWRTHPFSLRKIMAQRVSVRPDFSAGAYRNRPESAFFRSKYKNRA